MNETSREPVKASPFVLRHFLWFAIGSLLLVAVGGVLVCSMPSQEQQIAREIESSGGRVEFEFLGPDWIPTLIQNRLPFWNHITSVDFSGTPVTDAGLVPLKGLTNLMGLEVNNTKITDAGLEHLKGLTSLNWMDLSKTPITDAGLEHLKGLKSLNTLFLDERQVTAKSRTSLRKALPSCRLEIVP